MSGSNLGSGPKRCSLAKKSSSLACLTLSPWVQSTYYFSHSYPSPSLLTTLYLYESSISFPLPLSFLSPPFSCRVFLTLLHVPISTVPPVNCSAPFRLPSTLFTAQSPTTSKRLHSDPLSVCLICEDLSLLQHPSITFHPSIYVLNHSSWSSQPQAPVRCPPKSWIPCRSLSRISPATVSYRSPSHSHHQLT